MSISIKHSIQSTQHHLETFLTDACTLAKVEHREIALSSCFSQFLPFITQFCLFICFRNTLFFFLHFAMHIYNEKMICVLITALLLNDEKNINKGK